MLQEIEDYIDYNESTKAFSDMLWINLWIYFWISVTPPQA